MPDASFTQFFFDRGILGVITLVLAGVIVILYRDNAKKDKVIYDLQNSYMVDYKGMAKDGYSVMNDTAQALNVISAKIESGKGR